MLTLDLSDGADRGAVLAPLEPWQAPEFAAFVERERTHLAPWLPWAETIVDEGSARAFLQRYADRAAADGPRIWSLRVDGEMVGGTLFRVFEVDNRLCEIGVWLAAGAQGRGLVARAATAMIDWAVLVRDMHRVEWHCVPENLPSRAVATRLGMVREAVLREAFEHRGKRHDVEVWALLAPDWRARRDQRSL